MIGDMADTSGFRKAETGVVGEVCGDEADEQGDPETPFLEPAQFEAIGQEQADAHDHGRDDDGDDVGGDFGSSRKVNAANAASSAAPGTIDMSAGLTFSSLCELRLKIGVRMRVEIIQPAPERLIAMRATMNTRG
jgi:hypothetical protein